MAFLDAGAQAQTQTSPRFVVTPWRSPEELLRLRGDLYGRGEGEGGGGGRRRGVDKVLAWRARKTDLPLLLDSTADLVDVVLVDEGGGLEANALRLLYATAISRFMTGLSDTQIDLTRDRPAWFPPGATLQLPITLLETRHCIVHRHLPSLSELKRASKTALTWLWDWYWSQLEAAFGLPSPTHATKLPPFAASASTEALKAKLTTLLRTYIKERKAEIKARAPAPSAAASRFHATYTTRFCTSRPRPSTPSIPATATAQEILVEILTSDALLLPPPPSTPSQQHQTPLNIPGALTIFTPLLHTLCTTTTTTPTLYTHLLSSLLSQLHSTSSSTPREKEAWCAWIAHLLCDASWTGVRPAETLDRVLGECFSRPDRWGVRLAEVVVGISGGEAGERWGAVLEAAAGEEGVGKGEEDEDEIEEEEEEEEEEKIRGPVKVTGLWKARPIGTLPEGWDEDE